ncbi:hypothetical protein XVE_3695 [Xanthomonas vesicatoria ATCC 35937]|uniref:Uncharacterized protein n=1 Tax=Xanthomonas vesicatoria ATCC 35937 TaxID=925775 RepID=F0BHG0_9XANT|nr:hypothetical protein XVE_3695 [Xanthomonas vesicatoria ATCC 35937]
MSRHCVYDNARACPGIVVSAAGSTTICRVIDALFHRHRNVQRIRVDPFQTADVVAVLVGIGAAAVMGIDAADAAEIVRGGVRVELIQAQHLFALQHVQAIERDRGDDGATAAAHRTIATAWIDQAVR